MAYNTGSLKERDRLIEALARCCGNVAESAELLSMPISSLYRKIKKYGLQAKKFV
jgi:transcriptional regulator of acetoin/glycerol metabolism